MGWPPRWVRDQPESNNSNQRALPPVPSSQTESNRADHIPDEDERVSTPELRPEDFPPGKYYFSYKRKRVLKKSKIFIFFPGVAYLPDGDDVEEPLEFGSKSNIIDFTASIEAVKNVIIKLIYNNFLLYFEILYYSVIGIGVQYVAQRLNRSSQPNPMVHF